MSDNSGRNFQAEADAQIDALVEGLPPEQAALALVALLNRAAVRLHNLTRAEASARKGEPTWPAWAGLQNAARAVVLQSSTCRDLATRLEAQQKQ